MAFNKPGDTIASNSGKVIATINGKNRVVAEVKEFEAKLEGNIEEVPVLGRRMKGHKITSVEGTGSMTLYHTTSTYTKLMADWVATGKYPDVSITVTVEDPTTAAQKQVFQLMGVVFADAPLASLDSDDGLLEYETDLTFDDFKLIQQFKD